MSDRVCLCRYRNLKNELDSALSSSSLLIDAPFPKTHRKSSMGMSLTDAELAERYYP